MTLQLLHLLLHLLLLLLTPPADAVLSCSLLCSTDYSHSVNCSCSTESLLVTVHLSCSADDVIVSSSCDIRPPLSWCSMLVEDLPDVASVGTLCTSTVTQQRHAAAVESSSWALADVVKLSAPFDVRVTNIQKSYNVSWSDDSDGDDCLTYGVRLRDKERPLKDSVQFFVVEQRNLLLDEETLRPRGDYVVDVHAKPCPTNIYGGLWSEWSPGVTWRVAGASTEAPLAEGLWWYVWLPVVLVLVLLLTGFLHKPCLQRKLEVMAFIPKPVAFFYPLYQSYGGNFKEWVKPVFSEWDYLNSPSLQALSSKQEEQQSPGVLHPLHQPSDSDGGAPPGVSLLSVRLAEERLEEQLLFRSSFDHLLQEERLCLDSEDSYPPVDLDSEDSYPPVDLDTVDSYPPVDLDSEDSYPPVDLDTVDSYPPVDLDSEDSYPPVDLDTVDSYPPVDLDSEDSYPPVDLDTVDSGFGETSASQEHKEVEEESSYVGQWVMGSTSTPD